MRNEKESGVFEVNKLAFSRREANISVFCIYYESILAKRKYNPSCNRKRIKNYNPLSASISEIAQ